MINYIHEDAGEYIRHLLSDNCKIISVIGSGGKTALLQAAVSLGRELRIGIAASTKMYPLNMETAKQWNVGKLQNIKATPGIYCFADELLANGKFHGCSQAMAAAVWKYLDLLMIEADGSAGKPLKGWNAEEPVIFKETDVTIGILPMHILGCEASPEFIHRFELFKKLTDINNGDLITAQVLLRAICHPDGLFKNARGRRILYLNHVISEDMVVCAQWIAAHVQDVCSDIWIGNTK